MKRFMTKLIPLMFFILLINVSGAQEQTPSNPDAEESNKSSKEEALPKKSSFRTNVGTENYRAVSPAKKAYKLRFNLRNKGKMTYDFSQKAKQKMNMGGAGVPNAAGTDQNIDATGNLVIKSKGDGTGDLILKNLKAKLKMGNSEQTREVEFPPSVLKGMNEAGRAESGDSRREQFLKMLFPIPGKKVKIGETVKLDRTFPVNASGTPLNARGHTSVTFTRMVNLDGKRCIQIDAETDISQLEVPKEVKGTYDVRITGKSRYYFHVRGRTFLKGTQALMLAMHSRVPVPQPAGKNKNDSKGSNLKEMKMVMDNLIKINLTKSD